MRDREELRSLLESRTSVLTGLWQTSIRDGTIFVQVAWIPALGGVERKGSRLELTPPSVGGSVRRPHAPPRWGRFFKRRRPGMNHAVSRLLPFLQPNS